MLKVRQRNGCKHPKKLWTSEKPPTTHRKSRVLHSFVRLGGYTWAGGAPFFSLISDSRSAFKTQIFIRVNICTNCTDGITTYYYYRLLYLYFYVMNFWLGWVHEFSPKWWGNIIEQMEQKEILNSTNYFMNDQYDHLDLDV